MKTIEILSAVGVLALLAEIFRFKKFLLPLILIGLLGAIGAAVYDWNTNIHYYHNMLTFDNYALLFSIVLCGTVFLWLLSSQSFFSDEHLTDKSSLAIFSLIGAVLIVSYSNMVMLFIGVEILSIPLYVLAGSKKNNLASNEAALKYFLMGAFASGFLLFGIALLYGCFGTFDLHTIQTYLTPPVPSQARPSDSQWILLSGGILFMLIGISFKASAVPFHFWAPDVYEGSPTQVTAFMASIVKTAAFAAFLRLFLCFANLGNVWVNVVWVMAGATILLGNITAVYQSSVKRMLAYSSISHAGYLTLAILSMNNFSAGAVLYYSASYSVATIGAFTVLAIIENNFGAVTFDSFSGLAKKNPFLAFAMTIAMLSLAGIPPLAGFFGKYYLFSSALQSGYLWIVLIAVLGSLIGVYYYFRVIITMYSTAPSSISPEGGENLLPFGEVGWGTKIVLIITILLSLALGLFPDLVIRLI
ncbi:MAG: NADH-quinone oxidoreductase subunit N [Bacteroidetes bacterium]|nr:NADH-quinone oxidoreductase subunit N [Bacteroidota bacterium]